MSDLLALIALSQVVLYLWYTGRVPGAVAASGFAGAVLFAALARAVREAFAEGAGEARSSRPRVPVRDVSKTVNRPARKVAVQYR